MQCFIHAENSALGICKNCGKAVCKVCVIDAPMFISCSEICAKENADVFEMNQRGKKIYGIGVPKKMPSGAIIYALFGVLMSAFVVNDYLRYEKIDWMFLLMSLGMFIIAIFIYRRAKDSGIQC